MALELLDFDDSQTTPTMQSDVYSFGSIVLQVCDVDKRSVIITYDLPEQRF